MDSSFVQPNSGRKSLMPWVDEKCRVVCAFRHSFPKLICRYDKALADRICLSSSTSGQRIREQRSCIQGEWCCLCLPDPWELTPGGFLNQRARRQTRNYLLDRRTSGQKGRTYCLCPVFFRDRQPIHQTQPTLYIKKGSIKECRSFRKLESSTIRHDVQPTTIST